MTNNQNEELYHYGVLGMRWGIRRYQPYSTTGPRKGGETGKEVGEAARKPTFRERRAAKKLAKQRRQNLQKAREVREKNRQEAEKRQKKKEAIIKSGNPFSVARHTDLFTTEELRELGQRIQLKEQIKGISQQKTQRIASYLQTANNVLGTSISVYNYVAQLSNAYNQQNGTLTKANYRHLVSPNLKPEELKDKFATVKNIAAIGQNPSYINNLTDDQVQDVYKRLNTMESIKKSYENINKVNDETSARTRYNVERAKQDHDYLNSLSDDQIKEVSTRLKNMESIKKVFEGTYKEEDDKDKD